MQMSLVPSAPDLALSTRPRRGVRWALQRIRGYSRGVQAPPAGRTEQALYGFAQPILGIRVLLSDRELLKEALFPAGLLGAACAIYASLHSNAVGWTGWFSHFYKAFAALAPLPSFFFANHYSRLAAMIRWRMGFGACGPREMPWRLLAGRMIRQALIVAIGIAPVVVLMRILPGIGDVFAQSNKKSIQRTELIIFIRPQIIRDGIDAAVVAEELRSKMRGAKVGSTDPPGAVVPRAPALVR